MEELVSQSFINEHSLFSLKGKTTLCSTSQNAIRDHAALLKYVTLLFVVQETFLFLFIFLHAIASSFMFTGFIQNTFFYN